MNQSQRRTLILSLILILTVFFLETLAGSWIERRLESTKLCETCSLEVSRVRVSFLLRRITMHQVKLSMGDPTFTEIESEIKRTRVSIALLPLWNNKILIRNLTLEQPKVVLLEGDGIRPPPDRRPIVKPWTYFLRGIKISDGTFTYTRVYKDRSARLDLSHIDAQISEIRSDSSDFVTYAEAEGQLEQSGKFQLKIEAPIFHPHTEAKVELKIKDQALADLNPFFLKGEGIRLTGAIEEARAEVRVKDRDLTSEVAVRYHGLDISFRKTKERSGIAAFFSNLAESLKVDSSNKKEKAQDRVSTNSANRESNEPLVGFVLRGMLEAALKVATN